MGKKWAIGVTIAVIVILAGSIFGSYNGLISLEESVNTKYSDVQTQLQRRSDLIPNLVSTVKGYATHEEEVYKSIADARAKIGSASNETELAEADKQLTSALSRLLVIAEAYPELKANENFLSLQDELAGTENRIGVARKDYNEAVQKYNTKIRKFPTAILANMFGFEKRELFEATEEAQNTPKVNFE